MPRLLAARCDVSQPEKCCNGDQIRPRVGDDSRRASRRRDPYQPARGLAPSPGPRDRNPYRIGDSHERAMTTKLSRPNHPTNPFGIDSKIPRMLGFRSLRSGLAFGRGETLLSETFPCADEESCIEALAAASGLVGGRGSRLSVAVAVVLPPACQSRLDAAAAHRRWSAHLGRRGTRRCLQVAAARRWG